MSRFAAIKPLVKNTLPHWIMGNTAMLAATLLFLLEPLVGKVIIDQGISKGNSVLFFQLLGVLIVVAIMALALETVGLFLLHMCQEKVRIRIQKDIIQAHLNLKNNRDELQSGEYQKLTQGDADEASRLLSLIPSDVVDLIFQFVLIAIIVTLMKSSLGLAAALAAGTLMFLSSIISKRISKTNAEFQSDVGSVANKLQQVHQVKPLIRQYSREKETIQSVQTVQDSAREAFSRLFGWESGFVFQERMLNLAILIAVAVITGLEVLAERMTIGEYVAIQVYITRIQVPLTGLLNNYKQGTKASVQLKMILNYCELPRLSKPKENRKSLWDGPIRLKTQFGSIAFERGHRYIVNGANTQRYLEWTQILNGSRFSEDSELLIGDQDIGRMPESIRKRWASTVRKSPLLFKGTFEENLTLGGQYPQDRIRRVLKDCSLPKSTALLDPEHTSLEDRIRMGVARALLFEPALVIMEDIGSDLERQQFEAITAPLLALDSTFVCFGESELLIELCDRVICINQQSPTSFDSIESFLSSPYASNQYLFGGKIRRALQSTASLEQAKAWAERHGFEPHSYQIVLFGKPDRIPDSLQTLQDAVKSSFRRSDVVTAISHTRLTYVLFESDPKIVEQLEGRLFNTTAQAMLPASKRGVYFKIDKEAA